MNKPLKYLAMCDTVFQQILSACDYVPIMRFDNMVIIFTHHISYPTFLYQIGIITIVSLSFSSQGLRTVG